MLVDKIKNRLSHNIQNNELTNSELVQIIEHIGSYLNIQTISDYAKNNNISYNGAKKFRKNITLFGVKFIIDND